MILAGTSHDNNAIYHLASTKIDYGAKWHQETKEQQLVLPVRL